RWVAVHGERRLRGVLCAVSLRIVGTAREEPDRVTRDGRRPVLPRLPPSATQKERRDDEREQREPHEDESERQEPPPRPGPRNTPSALAEHGPLAHERRVGVRPRAQRRETRLQLGGQRIHRREPPR